MSACGDGVLNVSAGEQCDGDVVNGICEVDTCAVTCDADFDSCDGDPLTGCEAALCGGSCDNLGPFPGMQQFDFSGSIEQFEVPACVTNLTIEVSGAQGGNGTGNGAMPGGLGATMIGDFMATPGDVPERWRRRQLRRARHGPLDRRGRRAPAPVAREVRAASVATAVARATASARAAAVAS